MGYYFQSSFNHTHIRNKADDSSVWTNDFLAIEYFGDPALKLKIYQEQHDMEVYSIAIKKDGGSYEYGLNLASNTPYDIYINAF